MKFLICHRQLLILLVALASVHNLGGEQPNWWTDGNPRVINEQAENNYGPANIGQAKWIASEALRALEDVDPALADSVREKLTVPQPNPSGGVFPAVLDFSVPDPKTPEWLEKQKAPLLIGQLKAIAAPFYDGLHEADAEWLAAQLVANQTQDAGDATNYYPWTSASSDDANRAIATIGQLKAVFSLRFDELAISTEDSDSDGIPDWWENLFGLNPHDPSDAVLDSDGDGMTNFQEFEASRDPRNNDTDGDGLIDSAEASLGTSPTDVDTDNDGIPDGVDSAPLTPATVPLAAATTLMIWSPLE